MKFTLKGCEHKALEAWGSSVGGHYYATCLSCYERLDISALAWDGHDSVRMNTRAAPPPAPCPHAQRKPVAAEITKHMPFRDAICTVCGVIQRHPDGRGVWTDVMFYGYLIEEEP